MASAVQSSELQSVVALIKTLTNAQLKDILRSEGLAVSGVKASLQLRIIDCRITFKDSPFYTILEQLTPTVECKIREQTRDNVELKVVLTPTVASRLQADPNLRVMIYCAADSGLNQYTKSDIAFPHQVELKANLDEVKANLKGLKNKPGTTRPADVTNYIRKKPGFFVLVNLVQRHPIEDLVLELKRRKTITKEQVLREMKNRAEDSDIVATSAVMSLKCPLSTLRIEVPCRTVVCTHNQCFDASSFLQLQEQAPTWSCPVCSKATSYESLQVDQYVDDILHSTSPDVEQVIIEPDGKWSSPKEDEFKGAGGVTPATEDEDELIEIKEPGIVHVKQESLSASVLSLERTPAQSREPSATSSATRLSTNKRPAAQVIDLTGSDDDGDLSPVRPAKRLASNAPHRAYARPAFRNSFSSGLVNGGNFSFTNQTNSESPRHIGGFDA
ncbi:hypothetical protein CNMCM8980_002395 [Aspergillus fumigatiaffinis]|uniref:MIZ zinc finger protein n=1 Tax=Aspergillus fumigatiaffinis TaxID=340414 RepID=A0A8H4M6B6_9EURO|nr:hypothetical protein CNMCM5878_000196 [Aspergillus fumigatiaffinis]KAF4231564.1 hypothetical protein CNMCM6805_000079 [Aspergillus fumigatiaffinis]KAF4237708.1 hypothetical protein CNMCM8980_002395 [Aspergillus fumigatiaffinis]